ncbi:hypothetical protein BDM02DRAFT_3184028 [Thelephora ganbajun]|uniref:Uncharacterized protein n=1 Tax=Thelephora ganbajun TaxID=370292 RepID=A0ACB6ZQU5_THEGA|nr:hypothetical protein BDM02DRAFT_3184028 [Thelephora ganbajun]
MTEGEGKRVAYATTSSAISSFILAAGPSTNPSTSITTLWNYIQPALDHIVRSSTNNINKAPAIDVQYHMGIHTAVYNYFTSSVAPTRSEPASQKSPSSKADNEKWMTGMDIYERLDDYYASAARELFLGTPMDDSALVHYLVPCFHRYSAGAQSVNRLLNYVNRHFVKRAVDEDKGWLRLNDVLGVVAKMIKDGDARDQISLKLKQRRAEELKRWGYEEGDSREVLAQAEASAEAASDVDRVVPLSSLAYRRFRVEVLDPLLAVPKGKGKKRPKKPPQANGERPLPKGRLARAVKRLLESEDEERHGLAEGLANALRMSKKKKCDGGRPRCTTCRRARTVQECVYESADHPAQPTFSSSFETLPPLRIPDGQVFLHDPTRAVSSSRVGPPSAPSFPTQVPAPQPPMSHAVVRGSVPVRYEFVHVAPPRPTLYTLPFRLVDIIDPAAFPISDSTTSELSMKFRILALAHRLQLGIPLTFAKQHAIALGDISNTIIHRFFTYFMTVYGCHLDQERRRNFDLIHVQALLTQLCLETVLTMVEAENPFSFIQAYCFMANSCFYTYTYVPGKRYLKKAIDIAKRSGIRMVDRSFSDSSDSPSHNTIMDPPPEYLESVQERVATLTQLIFTPLQHRLLTGEDIPLSDYLEDQFRNELPYAYPRMWDEMPEVLRLRALLLVDDTDKFIETYNLPSRSMYAWLSECRGVVPQLTDLNDLLVKRAAGAAALPDRETYLTFRCCSIFVLASLAQLYDIIARSPITPPNESFRFRVICDDTLKDIAKITVDFTKDDYSFLEPTLSVSWVRASSLVVVEEDPRSSPVSTGTRSSASPDPENLPSLIRMFLDAKSNLETTIRLTPAGMGVSVVHSMIAVKPIRHDPYTPDLLSEDVRLKLGL